MTFFALCVGFPTLFLIDNKLYLVDIHLFKLYNNNGFCRASGPGYKADALHDRKRIRKTVEEVYHL